MGRDLANWLHIEAPKRQIYESPPLALALCQVRFATKFGLNDSGVASFQEALGTEYPIPERQQEVASIQIGQPAGPTDFQQATPSILWKFTDQTGDWTVTLTQDFVTLETRAYADFDDFLQRLQKVLQTLIATVKPGIGRRIGLRYINEIRSRERVWLDIIRADLLGVLALDSFRESADQAIQVLSLRAGEAHITLQHGLFPTGTTVVPKPGVQAETLPFYLLDVDMYQEFAPPEPLQMDAVSISEYVERYHTTVSELFRWVTTDEYRVSLGSRDDVR